MNGVMIFHLISGAPIIAKFISKHGGTEYVLEDPLYIRYDETSADADSPGAGNFQINDLLILSDDSTVSIERDKVLFKYAPAKDLLEHYNSILLNKIEPVDNTD
jgi:hypothetical protein